MPRPWSNPSRLSLLLIVLASCAGPRASRVPLGGERDRVVLANAEPASSAATAAASSDSASTPPSLPSAESAPEEPQAERAEVAAVDPAPANTASPAAASAFQLRPYAAGQSWTRSFDLDVVVRVGPGGGLEMRMASQQEARFEVLAARAGTIDKLAIEYVTYKSSLTVMGSTQDSPEEIAGKRYVITFPNGKPDVKTPSGATPSKKEVDSVKDDAREPTQMALGLKELSQLAAKGRGDFTLAGAVALAGGEDEDTKVANAKASLRQLGSAGPRGERSALLDLSYTLTNLTDDGTEIEAQLTGTLLVLDAPARVHTVTLSGPLELRSSDADGMSGTGTTKLNVTYKY